MRCQRQSKGSVRQQAGREDKLQSREEVQTRPWLVWAQLKHCFWEANGSQDEADNVLKVSLRNWVWWAEEDQRWCSLSGSGLEKGHSQQLKVTPLFFVFSFSWWGRKKSLDEACFSYRVLDTNQNTSPRKGCGMCQFPNTFMTGSPSWACPQKPLNPLPMYFP